MGPRDKENEPLIHPHEITKALGASGENDDLEIKLGEKGKSKKIEKRERPTEGYEIVEGEGEPHPVYFNMDVLWRIKEELNKDKKGELGGVLVGLPFTDEKGQWLRVTNCIPAPSGVRSATEFKFTHESWPTVYAHLDQLLEGGKNFVGIPNLRIVGWYHSHPGHDVFMSDYDKFIQNKFFTKDPNNPNGPEHIAYVYDPVKKVGGLFKESQTDKPRPFYTKKEGDFKAPQKESEFGEEGSRKTDREACIAYWRRGGWKLHLTVKPENYEAVDKWLWENHRGQYKLLRGGDSGQKDFTVYIGSKEDADAFAKKIQDKIGDLLEPSNAGGSDRLFSEKVAQRFDVGHTLWGKTRGLDYYGYNGIPGDRLSQLYNVAAIDAKEPSEKEEWREKGRNHLRKIGDCLVKEFGEYFTGPGGRLAEAEPAPYSLEKQREIFGMFHKEHEEKPEAPKESMEELAERILRDAKAVEKQEEPRETISDLAQRIIETAGKREKTTEPSRPEETEELGPAKFVARRFRDENGLYCAQIDVPREVLEKRGAPAGFTGTLRAPTAYELDDQIKFWRSWFYDYDVGREAGKGNQSYYYRNIKGGEPVYFDSAEARDEGLKDTIAAKLGIESADEIIDALGRYGH